MASDEQLLAEVIDRSSPVHFASLRSDRTMDKLIAAWEWPVRSELERISKIADKPLGQLTVPEAMDWLMVLTYGALTGLIAGTVIVNLSRAATGYRR